MASYIKRIWKDLLKHRRHFLVSLLIFSLLVNQFLILIPSVYAASSPWLQTDWSGGSGQTNLTDATKYDSTSNITTSTSGQATLTSTEELSNTGFESDLTSWSEVPSYTLNDQFTTDLAAGSVNGTSAEPTGGTRTVTDTTSKLSISSGELTLLANTSGNPRILWDSITRAPGVLMTGKYKTSVASLNSNFGLGNSTTGFESGLAFHSSNNFIPQSAPYPVLGPYVTDTNYQYSTVLRSSGAYHFVKGGIYTNWTLLWLDSSGSTATLYPKLSNSNGNNTADNIRVPTTTWLPTPLAYDTFTRSDGTIGSSETTGPDSQTTPSLEWTGGAISTNTSVITPTQETDLWDADAAAFTSGTYAWTAYGTNTIANVANALQVTYVDNPNGVYNYLRDNADLSTNLTVGQWYAYTSDASINSGSANLALNTDSPGTYRTSQNITSSTPSNFLVTGRAGHAILDYVSIKNLSADEIVTLDNSSLKPLTLSSLFSSVSTSDTDVIADANVTMTAGTQAGIVTNLDSTSTPANFLIAYHDGTNVRLDKNVGGTYTNLINTAATYSAGATLRVITYTSSGSLKVRVYYNNALVGTEQTVSDAGIISNTKHGLFSTYSGNSFDNFTLFARGTGAEYTSAPFEELTATRDTVTAYNSSTASVKLVASGTDANYLQSANVGDTNTYNLTAYAYTDGSAVTSADLELYFDDDVLSTTYTSVGDGWYKLSGTLTGVASAKDYGVRVKAGKTVYVDDISVNRYETSGTLTSSIFDTEFTGGALWGTLTYSSTGSTVSVKARTSDSSSMSGATDFTSCTAITSGSDISSNSCVTDSDRYIQYQLTLSTSDTLATPTFSDISISFETFDSEGPTLTLDSPGGDSYTSQERPTFKWKEATDTISSISDYDLTIDNPSLGPTEPSGDFTISDIPVSRTTDYETTKYVVHYEGFSDSDSTNNYISVYTKSSSEWSRDSNSGQNDGKLREGIVRWTVKATDSVGNETTSSRTLFVDRTSPRVELTQINSSAVTTDTYSTTDVTPTIYGKVTDPLSGGNSSQTQTEYGPRVASGPKQVDIRVEKKEGLLYKLHTLYTINIDKAKYTCDNTEVTDNSKQKCDKYLSFEYTQGENLDLGTYRVTVTGKDRADNTSSTSLTLNVTTLSEVATPEEEQVIEEKLQVVKQLPQEEQKSAIDTLEITKPIEPSIFQKLGEELTKASNNVSTAIGVLIENSLSAAGQGIKYTFGAVGNTFSLVANRTGDALTDWYDSTKVSIAITGQLIENLLASAGQGLSTAGKATADGYDSLTDTASGVSTNVLLALGTGLNELKDTTSEVTESITKSMESASDNIGQGLRSTGSAITQGISGVKTATQSWISNLAFTVGVKTGDVSHSLGTAIIKIGYLFVPEPTTISNVKVAKSTPTTMTIAWETNHPANGKVNYGLSADYGQDVQSEKRITEHEFTITGLTPNTTYYYEVMSHNRNYVYDANHTFTTPEE